MKKDKLLSYVVTLLFAIALFLPLKTYAQVQVEEEVTTDTIDLFAKSDKPEKSSTLASCANLLIPGLGHYYLGNQKAAFGFFAAELALLYGAFTTNQYSHEIAQSARSYAMVYANIQGGAGADDYYWQNVGLFMDSDGLNQSRSVGFNQVQDLNRTPENKYTQANLQWRWSSDNARKTYNDYLKKSINYKVASNFFIGALILDRLVAFVDARVAAMHSGKGLLTSLRVTPHYNPVTDQGGLVVYSEF